MICLSGKAWADSRLLDHPYLTADSQVWEVGAYMGKWTEAIIRKWGCRVTAFEPIQEYAIEITKRHLPAFVVPYALGVEMSWGWIRLAHDSSFVQKSNVPGCLPVAVLPIHLLLTDLDLMQMNCEGGEYEMLPSLCATGDIKRIRNLQVQFHGTNEQSEAVGKQLEVTHDCVWAYGYTWQLWRLKG